MAAAAAFLDKFSYAKVSCTLKNRKVIAISIDTP
jgi:hypothetical protein